MESPAGSFVRDTLVGWLKENAKKLLGWATGIVGPVVLAWFLSPDQYLFRVTRLEAAFVVLALFGLVLGTAFVTRRAITDRRKFHLTPHGSRNFWGTTILPDGSINAQFTADFVAKNMSQSVQRLIRVKMVSPRVLGKDTQRLIFGPGGSVLELKPDAAKIANVSILIQAARLEVADVSLDAVFVIGNDEGYEQRVKTTLRPLVHNKQLTDGASTGSPPPP